MQWQPYQIDDIKCAPTSLLAADSDLPSPGGGGLIMCSGNSFKADFCDQRVNFRKENQRLEFFAKEDAVINWI